MFKATREIYEALNAEEGLKVFTDDQGERSSVWLQFTVKNGSAYRINFISVNDDYDVAVRVFNLANVSEDIRPKMLEVLNRLNNKYRFVCFALNDNGDIIIQYDLTRTGTNPAASAKEIVIRIVQIVSESYPEIMKAIWA